MQDNKLLVYQKCIILMQVLSNYFDEITLAPGCNRVFILTDRFVTNCVNNYEDYFHMEDFEYKLRNLVFIRLIGEDDYFVIQSYADYRRTKLGIWCDSNGYGRDTTEFEPYLHRQIIDAPKGFVVHHKGDKFNNLRSCLTLVDRNRHIRIHKEQKVKRQSTLIIDSNAMLIKLLKRILVQEQTL